MAEASTLPNLPRSAALPVIIDPVAAVAHCGWCEARDAVLRAVEAGPRLILIVGAPGSGKSLLLRALAARLRQGFDVMLLTRGDLAFDDTAMVSDGRRRVVLIDQARRLNETVLGGLARLGDCTVVLTGLADQNAGERLSNAAATVVTLPMLGADEVGDFLATRLARAGLPVTLFDPAGVAALADKAGGQPRRLNMLASAALNVAREHGVTDVGKLEVEQAARLLDQPAREPYAMPEPRPEMVPRAERGVGAPERPATLPLPPAAVASTAPERLEPSPGLAAMMAVGADRRGGLVLGTLAAAFVVAAVGGWLARHHAETAGRTAAAAPPAALSRPAPAAAVALLTLAPVMMPPAAEPPLAEIAPPPLDAPPSAAAPEPAHLADATPAAAPPVSAAPALPDAAPTRLVLLFERGDAAATARASSLATALAARGFVTETRPVRGVTGAGVSVRYFFAEDRGAADAVLAASGLPGRTLQATPGADTPALRPGLIELVLPAGGPPAVGETRTRLVQTTVEGRVP